MEPGGRAKRSIDDIWRELNAPRAGARGGAAAAAGVAGGFGIPGVTTQTRILPRNAPAPGGGGAGAGGSGGAGGAGGACGGAAGSAAPPPLPPPQPVAPEVAGVSGGDLQAYLSGLQVGARRGRAWRAARSHGDGRIGRGVRGLPCGAAAAHARACREYSAGPHPAPSRPAPAPPANRSEQSTA
jgi:hypothetical protein